MGSNPIKIARSFDFLAQWSVQYYNSNFTLKFFLSYDKYKDTYNLNLVD